MSHSLPKLPYLFQFEALFWWSNAGQAVLNLCPLYCLALPPLAPPPTAHYTLNSIFFLPLSVLSPLSLTVSLCCGSCGLWRTDIHQHKARVPYYVCVCLCMHVCVVLHVGSCGLEGPCSWPVGEGEVQTYFNIIVPWNMHEHTHIEETLQHCGFSFFTSFNIGKPPRFRLTFPVPPRPQLSLRQCQADVAVVLLSGIIVDLLETRCYISRGLSRYNKFQVLVLQLNISILCCFF